MRRRGPNPYNTVVSDGPDPTQPDDEADGLPLDPIPLPPDPLGRWLDGQGPDPAAGEEVESGG